MRIDEYLVKNGFAKSRERAKELIKNGFVRSNGIPVKKPSENAAPTEKIEITSEILKYVGRGGIKLEKALDVFDISLSGKKCADFGASTGGFTDCMLCHGASEVYAVDVGHGQLDEKLKNDNRVHNIEGLNLKDITSAELNGTVSFIGCDVSFISVRKILPKIYDSLSEYGEAVILIKPQFEAGRENIGKNGIVKSEKVHIRVLDEMIKDISSNGFSLRGLDYSPISGGDGNIEYLAYLKKDKNQISCVFDTKRIVSDAFEKIKRNDKK